MLLVHNNQGRASAAGPLFQVQILGASGGEIQESGRQSEHDFNKHLFVDQAIASLRRNRNVSAAILLSTDQCSVLFSMTFSGLDMPR